MCGILVQVSERIDLNRFTGALNLQEHRGPDDYGVWHCDGLAFGHRRLSIIDLNHSASQPMHSENEDVSIVFNGEIYNFLELRSELEEKGYTFRTNGDTEVLINLYRAFGISMLERLIGMFSFSLYDHATKELFVVRDRLGVKPLYYHYSDDGFVFSSEVKSILALLDDKPEFNASAISSYFSFRYPILNDSFFEGINSVKPGHYLRVKEGVAEEYQYWDLAPCVAEQKNDKGEEYYLSETARLLESAVAYREISDVKVGAYLSGGVDSSAVTALMAKEGDKKVPTFTIGFEEEGYNEFEYANIVAERYKTDHHEIILGADDYFTTMQHLINVKDAPLSVPNEVPLYLMSKELKKYITVVLSGEGADEIFGGYGRIFRSTFEYEKLQELKCKDELSDEEKAFIDKIQRKYGKTDFEDEVDHFFTIYSYTNEKLKDALLTPACHNSGITQRLKDHFRSTFNELGPDASYLNRMMYTFEKVHLVGLLQRVDMTTMATSVEARVPFVDHRLVEFAFSIPTKYKLKWMSETVSEDNLLVSEEISEKLDQPKFVLKKSLEPLLDDSVLYRKKMGFPVPLDAWFNGNFSETVKTILNEENLANNFFNKDKLLELVESSTKTHADAMKVWMTMNLYVFCKSFFAK